MALAMLRNEYLTSKVISLDGGLPPALVRRLARRRHRREVEPRDRRDRRAQGVTDDLEGDRNVGGGHAVADLDLGGGHDALGTEVHGLDVVDGLDARLGGQALAERVEVAWRNGLVGQQLALRPVSLIAT